MRTMHTSIGAMMITLGLSVGWVMGTTTASAMTSPSYQMQDTFGGYATGDNGAGANFIQNDNGMTWYNTGLRSTSYQITNAVTGGSASSSSSSSSNSTSTPSSSISSSSSVTTGGGSRGGRAGDAVSSVRSSVGQSTASSVVSQSSSSRSRLPRPNYPAAPEEEAQVRNEGRDFPIYSTDSTGAPISLYTLRFFDSVAPHGIVLMPMSLNLVFALVAFSIFLLITTTVSIATAFFCVMMRRAKTPQARARVRRILRMTALSVLLTLIISLVPFIAHGANTTIPLLNAYNGTLLDSSGNPVTSAVKIRFSYWKSSDYQSSDTTGTGAINSGAAQYAGWQEVQDVTPSSKGSFSVNLGSITPLLNLQNLTASTLQNLYLQVEVKPAASSDLSYEVLDINAADSGVDRSRITSVPFALNADLLDQHDTGTGSGNIPVLEFGGKLPISTMAGGTNLGTFTIDKDNTETSEISLEFGALLGKKLTYDITNSVFKFNASVQVQGNLTVTGLINGVDISSLTPVSDALKASSGGGLNLNVHGGSYRLNGIVTNYGGGSKTLVGSTTNFVFFGSGGLTTNVTGFPTDEAFIPVAQVSTSAGSISSISDRRITVSDDRERTVTTTFTPAYEKASYQGDGSDNVGQLSISHDNITLNNFYQWSTTKGSLQDYDLLLRVPVSEDFVRWKSDAQTNPISFAYRTTSASTAQSKLDIQIFDTNGTPVSLSGSTTNLANTSWTTAQVEFSGTPVWTAGQDMLIRIKFTAKDSYQAHLGTLKLNRVELLKE